MWEDLTSFFDLLHTDLLSLYLNLLKWLSTRNSSVFLHLSFSLASCTLFNNLQVQPSLSPSIYIYIYIYIYIIFFFIFFYFYKKKNIYCSLIQFAQSSFKGVLLCSFTKSWFCFGGVLEHALMLDGSKITLFFHIIYIITIPFSPAWHKRLD